MKNIFEQYPFLKEIPEKDLASLDLKALAIPGKAESHLLAQLSFKINKNIVVYNKFYKPVEGHLCQYIKFAQLNEQEFLLVKELERKFDAGKVVVAYEKPLIFN